MTIDIQKLKALAELSVGWGDLSLAPDVVLELVSELERHQGLYDHMKSIREAAGYESWTEVLVAAEKFHTAYKEFSDKTAWVIPSAETQELGMHVADILRKRCDDLTAHCQAQADEIVRLRKDAERLNWLDGKYINIVEGQTMLDPHGELVAHEWSIRGPFSEVRDAIDDAMAEEQP